MSVYKEVKNEKFLITNITKKDYGFKIDLKGKEKVIGYYYLDKDKSSNFLKHYPLGSKVIVTGEKQEINNNTVFNTFNYKKYLISNEVYCVIKITDIKKTSNEISFIYKLKNTYHIVVLSLINLDYLFLHNLMNEIVNYHMDNIF